jgi:hypothetical protein
MSLEERFASKLVPAANGCIEWGASRFPQGYGQIKVNYQNRKAHRVAWELAHGPIPDGLVVCHRCDNPPCCNVDHLFLGTHSDNTRDMHAKGRANKANARKTHCPRGHEYSPENTRVNGRGSRTCLACDHAYGKARWAKEKATSNGEKTH